MILVDGKIIEIWRGLIQSGQGLALRQELQCLELKRLKRAHFADIANLARRVNLPQLSIRLLHPVLRPVFGESDASDSEKCEYAAALAAIGAHAEADALLKEVDPGRCPSALLFQSFLHIYAWDYRPAAMLLRRFLDAESAPYQKRVAEINLISALINTDALTEATDRLGRLQAQVTREDAALLYGNLLEQRAQIALRRNDDGAAAKHLEESARILEPTGNVSLMYTRKWQAVLSARKDPSRIGLLDQVKKEAKEFLDWETVRDCDLQRSLILSDRRLFTQVYYGSPHTAYRELILPRFSGPPPGDEYLLHTRPSGEAWPLRLDLYSGELANAKKPLKPHQLPHRFLKALCSDLYRPILLGTLFSRLFPQEHFNPTTSPDRVYQGLRRVRRWCAENDFVFHIDTVGEGYLFRLRGPCTIRYGREFLGQPAAVPPAEERLQRLRLHLGDGLFSAKTASEILSLPLRSTNRFVKDSLESGQLVQIGQGAKTKYRLAG